MMRWLFVIVLVFACAAPASASSIRYYEDPVYQPINKEDPHPMQDLLDLADQGDIRAQYILGDLYGKGKGGLGKNQVKARYWLETSARNGYTMSFIRLAAMAKRAKDGVSAYKWYTLNLDHGSSAERKWSSKQRDNVVKDFHLSNDDIREAKEAVNDWLKKREAALKEDRERAKAAREAAAVQQDTLKITGKETKAVSTRIEKKEHSYNE